MTLMQVKTIVDCEKPNDVPQEVVFGWINDVDTRIFNEIIKTHEGAEGMEFDGYDGSDWDAELFVESPYSDLYKYYVMAQIDMRRSENSKYNSDLAQFNDCYQKFANWYNRTHMHIQKKLRY